MLAVAPFLTDVAGNAVVFLSVRYLLSSQEVTRMYGMVVMMALVKPAVGQSGSSPRSSSWRQSASERRQVLAVGGCGSSCNSGCNTCPGGYGGYSGGCGCPPAVVARVAVPPEVITGSCGTSGCANSCMGAVWLSCGSCCRPRRVASACSVAVVAARTQHLLRVRTGPGFGRLHVNVFRRWAIQPC